MKKAFKIFSLILIVCVIGFALIACDNGNNNNNNDSYTCSVNWVAPMLAFNVDAQKCADGTFEIGLHDTLAITSHRITSEGVTKYADLGENAVKVTAQFAYQGDKEWNARFRVAVQEITWDGDDWGHANMIKNHTLPSVADGEKIFVLYEGQHLNENALWNIRGANFGGASTGGLADAELGIPASFLINKDTASNYASQDFYIVGLTEGRYVVSYFMTVSDYAGHWHNYDIIAHTTVLITVSAPNSPWVTA
ncbi:MAG: hypothetical protein FWD49_05730 [Firmicutes bacterium]|nr:hypothetical protein [Bacillota bacterium]